MMTDEHDNEMFEEELLSIGRIETSSKVTGVFCVFADDVVMEADAYMSNYFPKNTFDEFMCR